MLSIGEVLDYKIGCYMLIVDCSSCGEEHAQFITNIKKDFYYEYPPLCRTCNKTKYGQDFASLDYDYYNEGNECNDNNCS